MQINLTFNKPAAAQFFDEGTAGVKIRIEGKGKVMFKASEKESARDTFPLTPRTRGGVGITISGGFAQEFLKATGMDRGTHMELGASSRNWIAADAVEGKPSKVVPTARLWRAIDEPAVAKEDTAPTRAPRKARATATTGRSGGGTAEGAAKARQARSQQRADADSASDTDGRHNNAGGNGTAEGAAKARKARSAKATASRKTSSAAKAPRARKAKVAAAE